MRAWTALLGFAFAGSATAQGIDPASTAEILEAYTGLRGNPGMAISITSEDTTPFGTVTRASTVTFWKDVVDGREVLKAEVLTSVGGNLVFRAVGDGITFASYDLARKTFALAPYGRYDGTLNENYRRDFFNLLTVSVKDDASLGVRLVREVFASDTAPTLRNWLPGTPSVRSEPDEVTRNITFVTTSVPERAVAIALVRADETAPWTLTGIQVEDRRAFGGGTRHKKVMLTPAGIATAPDPGAFTLYGLAELAGYRQIVFDRPVRID